MRWLGKFLIHSLCENKTFLRDEPFYSIAKKLILVLQDDYFVNHYVILISLPLGFHFHMHRVQTIELA